jgi:hypothetical protein
MTRDITRDLQKRLQKLEAQMACRPEPKAIYFYRLFLVIAIKQYLRNPESYETPLHAYEMTLRFATQSEFKNAVKGKDPILDERSAQVASRLLAEFGVSLDDKSDVLAEAFERMEAGLSERYKEALCRVAWQLGLEPPICLRPRGAPDSETSADGISGF